MKKQELEISDYQDEEEYQDDEDEFDDEDQEAEILGSNKIEPET